MSGLRFILPVVANIVGHVCADRAERRVVAIQTQSAQ
jgi:hypothetical protein